MWAMAIKMANIFVSLWIMSFFFLVLLQSLFLGLKLRFLELFLTQTLSLYKICLKVAEKLLKYLLKFAH